MTEDQTIGHNSHTVLDDFVRRIEQINREMADIKADLKEIYNESRLKGFDPKVLRALIKKRASDQEKLRLFEETLVMYEHAVQLKLPLAAKFT
jgi:uncharacterized protein (UPF0335 family)